MPTFVFSQLCSSIYLTVCWTNFEEFDQSVSNVYFRQNQTLPHPSPRDLHRLPVRASIDLHDRQTVLLLSLSSLSSPSAYLSELPYHLSWSLLSVRVALLLWLTVGLFILDLAQKKSIIIIIICTFVYIG